jgi:hypothetical protein
MSTDKDFEELWDDLDHRQRLVAQEYVFAPTRKEAAKRADVPPSTMYGWDAPVFEAAEKLVEKRTEAISEGLKSLSKDAIDTLKDGLEGKTELSRVEMETAQYVLNKVDGKPTQKQEVEHSGGIDLDPDDLDEALDHLD